MKRRKNVTVNWQDDELSRLKYEMAPFEAFEEYPEWEAKGKEELAKKGLRLFLLSHPTPTC